MARRYLVICYVIGARGRLGQAIADVYADCNILLPDRSIYEAWTQPNCLDAVSRYFERDHNQQAIAFVAAGLLDPNLEQSALFGVNYHLPRNIIDGAGKHGIKVVTFGTAMEGLLKSQNPYIQSKAALGKYVREVGSLNGSALHVQIHTLFGIGEPNSFMFLGQMLAAIRSDRPFKMTSGRQLREYHHLADEAKAIRKLAESASAGVVNLSHGKPLPLRDIATSVFDAFGKSTLLHIGGLPEPPEENYEEILQASSIADAVKFRDPLPAIVAYMQACEAWKR